MSIDLVTGGSGFIGRHLVQALLQRGRKVRVLDRADFPTGDEAVDFMRGSILDGEIVARATDGADRVFHVAGNPQLWAREGFDADNRSGAEIVLTAAHRAGVSRIVLTSTHAIDVRSAHMPGPYTRAKFQAEATARHLIGQGAPITIVAPTMPLGSGDVNLTPPTRMVLDFLHGKNPAYLEFETNLIDVREVAEGHILAAEKGEVGKRYVLGRHNLMMSDLLQHLERLSGTRMPRRRIPYWLALGSAAVMQTAARLSGQPPQASLEGVRLARHLLPVPENPAAALGLAEWPLEPLLSETIDWLNRHA